jgi:Putative lumazine-binding
MPRAAPILLVLLALAAAGCGVSSGSTSSNKFQGEQRLVANTIGDLQTAGKNGDQDKVCNELLARELAQKLGDCPKVVDAALKDTDSFDMTVQSVRLQGTTAVAVVKSDRGKAPDETDTIRLVKQDGRWKIAAL